MSVCRGGCFHRGGDQEEVRVGAGVVEQEAHSFDSEPGAQADDDILVPPSAHPEHQGSLIILILMSKCGDERRGDR